MDRAATDKKEGTGDRRMALRLLSRKQYRASDGDIPIVCPVRDEIALLPHFIAHHRAIGVETFIFIDNDSKDGTTEYLLSEPGCIVYHTPDSFLESNYGTDWISELLHTHAAGSWAIYLDCDELLVYSQMESTPLAAFVSSYAQSGADCFFAIMVDLYPEGSWAGVSARTASGSILETMNRFDKDYIIRALPERPWRTHTERKLEVLGGPRCRLFSTLEREARRGWIDYMIAGQVDRFVDRVPISMMPALARWWPRPMSAIFKTPINHIGEGFRYPYPHESTNGRRAPVMLAVLHLKFSDELNARFDPMFSYTHHYQRGLERFRLAGALKKWPSGDLAYSGTRRYESSDSLLRCNIIGPAPARVWTDNLPSFRTGEEVELGPALNPALT